MSKIFITGGTGFIGNHLLQFLIRQKDSDPERKIVCLVRARNKIPSDLAPKVTMCEGDGQSLDKYAEVIGECDVIYHLAGNASLIRGADYELSNIVFTRRLIEIAKGSSRLKRFVFTSTIGAVDRLPQDDCKNPLDETVLPNPLSDYGRSKLACEKMLASSGLPYVILRPALVYGPGMRKNSHLRVFMDAVLAGRPFAKFDFPGRVSLIHVEDLVRALDLLSEHPDGVGKTFFVADEQPVSLGQLFSWIGSFLGKHAGDFKIPAGVAALLRTFRRVLPLTAQNLFSDVLWASSERLRALGWQTRRSPHDGILETVRWHLNQIKVAKRESPWAVVTGGAGGIGRALCEQLFARGYRIVSVDKVRQESIFPETLWRSLQFDLSDETSIRRLLESSGIEWSEVEIWINNAGIGLRGAFTDSDWETQNKVIHTNCAAPIALSHFVFKEFAKQKRGVLVNMASSSAFQPLPYLSVYAASKAFMLNWSEALAAEKQTGENGVKVITVCPAGVATGFQKTAGVRGENGLLDPAVVAGRILSSLSGPSRMVVIGKNARMMALAARCFPRGFQTKLWGRLMTQWR